jgi:hypothetical protein
MAITIPPTVNEPDYREYDVTVGGTQYSIVNEGGPDGDWALLQLMHEGWAHDWREISYDVDIDAFLRQHNLLLAD